MAKETAIIQVILDPESRQCSVLLDGIITHSDLVTGYETFVNFLEQATSDYWWWIGEAWIHILDEMENKLWEEETLQDSSQDHSKE